MGKILSWARRLGFFALAAMGWMPTAGFCETGDFTPKHIPLSPQLTHPHNGWIAYMPFLLMALVAFVFWWEFRHRSS